MSSANQPNNTLYINNLNDKINKDELRSQLLALFTTYGRIIDIVASKNTKMRGQAFLVFTDLAGATSAMRACEGMIFYDKPLRIDYAKTKSYATSRRDDPNFVPPNAPNASGVVNGTIEKKRPRDEDGAEGQPQSKKEKNDESDEEMEIDDDDEVPQNSTTAAPHPTARLLCTNLPQEVTDEVIAVLFQEHSGFKNIHVSPSPTGEPNKVAQATFESAEQASSAKEKLDGFTLKKGWPMSVVYI